MRRTIIGAACTAALTLGAHAAGITINLTPSVPVGLWRWAGTNLRRGMVVTDCPPVTPTLRLGQRRGYLASGTCPSGLAPLLKPIAAVAGDVVTIRPDGMISVNGKLIPNSRGLHADSEGRPLHPLPAGTYQVAVGEVWLISPDNPLSFDSRYLGPIPTATIGHVVKPLWTVR